MSILAIEAVSVGQLSSRQDWKALLDLCFDLREKAIRANEQQAFEVIGYFEPIIRDAQKSYALLIVFELSKDNLALDEFAFELLRTLGVLIESTLQPYIKELYCLLTISAGDVPDIQAVADGDFGSICERLETALKDKSLLSPEPWGVRVNQWRNIAQHHSFVVRGDSIVATYGRSQARKQVCLSRSELLTLAEELVRRLGALKTSRVITAVNHLDRLEAHLPPTAPDQYSHATALTASFATQGFRLLQLHIEANRALANIEDMAPTEGNERPIHCSQFVAAIANRFPHVSVQVQYVARGRHLWTFEATAEDLDRIMGLDDPLAKLARVVTFRKEP